MPLQATSGAASYDAFGGGAAAVPQYIEDVFSTYLYTGNGNYPTTTPNVITNGIDLAGKGGMVWIKNRVQPDNHVLSDSSRGIDLAYKWLYSNSTDAEVAFPSYGITSFNSTGFTLNDPLVQTYQDLTNRTGETYASWTFRKQPKFFDVVTYTGNGTAGRTISHSLKSAPACMFVKRLDTTGAWQVYHTWLGGSAYAVLNTTAAAPVSNTRWNNENPTSTVFTLGSDVTVNANGGTYVAYLFASNAGGFGLTGTDNVITCADYTGNGSATGPVITLGYEPQWILIKNATAVGDWNLIDNMRGFVVGGTDSELNPNLSSAESTGTFVTPTATGFQINTTDTGYNSNGQTYIYIAIRRGPMKVPTSGTSVFGLNARSGTGANATVTGGAGVSDVVLIKNRGSAVADLFSSRLTGTGYLVTSSTAAEVAAGTTILQANPWDVMDGVKVGTTSTITNASGSTFINYLFDRAPSFFDEVCYTGTGVARTINHNLGAVPELMIVKSRSLGTESWTVWNTTIAALNAANFLWLNSTSNIVTNSGRFNSTAPTSSVFTVGSDTSTNGSGSTYVAYLFATCAGVSKVGSYTGNGSSQTINCGFTGGARFVLIKRTDSTGDWYVWDSARGIVTGNDPYLLLNSTAAEVTNTDYIDTYSAGFEVSSTAPAAINANGGTYIFLAIA